MLMTKLSISWLLLKSFKISVQMTNGNNHLRKDFYDWVLYLQTRLFRHIVKSTWNQGLSRSRKQGYSRKPYWYARHDVTGSYLHYLLPYYSLAVSCLHHIPGDNYGIRVTPSNEVNVLTNSINEPIYKSSARWTVDPSCIRLQVLLFYSYELKNSKNFFIKEKKTETIFLCNKQLYFS